MSKCCIPVLLFPFPLINSSFSECYSLKENLNKYLLAARQGHVNLLLSRKICACPVKICQKQQQGDLGFQALLNPLECRMLCIFCPVFFTIREPEQQGILGRCVPVPGRTPPLCFLSALPFISSSKAFLWELRPLVVFVSGSAAGDKVVLFWRPDKMT